MDDFTRDVMDSVVGETKERKSEGKHYIPFTHKEWARLTAGSKRHLMPNDFKLLLLALSDGDISVVPRSLAEAIRKAA